MFIPLESPKILTASNISFANITDDIEFYCECENCLPVTDFSWEFNHSKNIEIHHIKDEKRNYFKTFLKINEVDETDNGEYTCLISNDLGHEEVSIELIVNKAPEIIAIKLNTNDGNITEEVKEEIELDEGDSLNLECFSAGTPEPTIYWAKNGDEISEDAILAIKNLSRVDDGTFECIARNSVGTTEKSLKISVRFPPTKENNDDISVESIEGNEITLTCDFNGKPVPEISWEFNSKKIKSNKKYNISGKTLKFVAENNDSGMYKCTATNDLGTESIDFPVIIKSKFFKFNNGEVYKQFFLKNLLIAFPSFISPNDESVKVENNSYLELPCEATGYPQPKLKYFRNNVQISDSTPFVIKSAKTADSGSYHCIIENGVGKAEKIFYVSVVKKPVIISDCKDVYILHTNQTKDITCSATGIPKPIIKWKYGGKIINFGEIIQIDSTFESGKLSCIAENSEGIDEKSFSMEIINLPKILPIAKDLQTNISIRVGDDLELLCPFENYNHIEWKLNGSEMELSDYKQIDRKLIISNVQNSHNGQWTCTASNIEGEDNFTYIVNVFSVPKIFASWNFNKNISDFHKNDAHLDQRTFKMDDSLLLNCTAHGNPAPNVEWRKGIDLIGRGEVLSIDKLKFHHR